MGDHSSLIEVSPEAADAIASGWHWLVPEGCVPLFSTVFGDVFVSSPSGDIFFLNTLDACLVNAADDQAHLLAQLNEEELRSQVLMEELAAKLSERLGHLLSGDCYSVKIPPTLGGLLVPENFHVLPLTEHLSALGNIQAQVANDPPGTQYQVLPHAG